MTVDSRVSTPRQTDVFAVKLDEQYLVECKFRSKAATIDDVDALRSRLARTKPSVVGLLVSRSGFSREAIANVKYQRHQPILLVDEAELRSIERHGASALVELIHRKKDALLRDAYVLLGEDRRGVGPQLPFPTPGRWFRSPVTDDTHVIDVDGGFDSTVFTHEVSEIDWAGPGHGVSMEVPLACFSEGEAQKVLAALNDLGWVTNAGRWSIDQIHRTWHGIGLEALTHELPRWRARDDHHSEQVTYVDRCDGGFYAVAFVVDSHESRRVSRMTISFLLNGVPLDTSPMLHLCKTLGAHSSLHLRPLGDRASHTYTLHQDRPLLAVSHQVIEADFFNPTDRNWVTGVVTENPFHRDHPSNRGKSLPAEHGVLADPRYLICSLRTHHRVDEHPTAYFLRSIEYAWADDRIVCHPVADFRAIPQVTRHESRQMPEIDATIGPCA